MKNLLLALVLSLSFVGCSDGPKKTDQPAPVVFMGDSWLNVSGESMYYVFYSVILADNMEEKQKNTDLVFTDAKSRLGLSILGAEVDWVYPNYSLSNAVRNAMQAYSSNLSITLIKDDPTIGGQIYAVVNTLQPNGLYLLQVFKVY